MSSVQRGVAGVVPVAVLVCSLVGLTSALDIPREPVIGGAAILLTHFPEGDGIDAFQVYLPEALESREKWPVIFDMHGSSFCGGEPIGFVSAGPSAWNAQERFILVYPHFMQQDMYEAHSNCVKVFLDYMIENWRADPDGIFFTGYSRGGYGVYGMERKLPEYCAGGIVMAGCPTGSVAGWADKPLVIMHGTADQTVSPGCSPAAASNIESAGGSDFLRVDRFDASAVGTEHVLNMIPDAGHGSQWSNVVLYDWLYDQYTDGVVRNRNTAARSYSRETMRVVYGAVPYLQHPADPAGSRALQVFSLSGDLLQTYSIRQHATATPLTSLSQLPAGMYTIQVGGSTGGHPVRVGTY